MKKDIQIIVSELYSTGRIKKLLSSFRFVESSSENDELKKDLEQEIIMLLLESKRCEKLIRLYARNDLERFLFGMIRNIVYDDRRRTWVKNYREYFQNKCGSINNTNEYRWFAIHDCRERL